MEEFAYGRFTHPQKRTFGCAVLTAALGLERTRALQQNALSFDYVLGAFVRPRALNMKWRTRSPQSAILYSVDVQT